MLNVKVPYEQIKPHVAGDLHKSNSKEDKEVKEEPCQSTGQSDAVTMKYPRPNFKPALKILKTKMMLSGVVNESGKKDQLDHC